jgi:hypothetical protein
MRPIALVALFLVACVRSPAAECPTSATAIVSSQQTGNDRQFYWTGDIAAPTDIVARDGTKGQVWIYRTNDPPLFLTLVGERIGVQERLSFELFRLGTEAPPVPFPERGTGYAYMPTQREPIFSGPGCWRVHVSGTSSEVVLSVK